MILSKNLIVQLGREIFAMTKTFYPNCLDVGMQIVPQWVEHKMWYEQCTQFLKLNNEFHNKTNTVMAVANTFWNIKVSVEGSKMKLVEKEINLEIYVLKENAMYW